MTQKERLEDIRKRHEEERQRKAIIRNRILLGAAAAAALLLVIVIIVSCVSAISRAIIKRNEEKKQLEAQRYETQQPAPTPSYTIDPLVVSQGYFERSAFIGNSFVDDLFLFGFLNDADYFYKTGLSVDEAMTEMMQGSDVPVINELDNGKKYQKIFLMFGENELGWISADSFIEQYAELIEKAKRLQPDAKIYLMSVTPVTKKTSEENIDSTNNEQIRLYNELIEHLAAREGAVYADIYKAVADTDGNLPEGAAKDGVHFGKEYYEKCLLYIQNNYQ